MKPLYFSQGFLVAVLLVGLLAARPASDPVLLEQGQFDALVNSNRSPKLYNVDQKNGFVTAPDGGSSPFSVDLTVPGDVIIDQVVEGEFVSEIGCVVVEPVVGIPKTDLNIEGNNTFVYENDDRFHEEILPWAQAGRIGRDNLFPGSAVGDSFALPFNVRASGAIIIKFETTDAAASGKLFCNIFGAP